MLLYSDVFTAAKLCLLTYGEYAFRIYMGDHGMNHEGYPDVDFIGMVGDKPVVLTEAQSPSVMTMAGNLLPVNGIKLTWARGQPFIAQLLQKVSAQSQMYLIFDNSWNCIGRFTSGSEKDGVDVPLLSQLLDHLPSCQERRWQNFSCLFTHQQYREFF